MEVSADEYYEDGFINAHVNIGAGEDCTIKELVQQITRGTGYEGLVDCDATKPEGTQRKLLDMTKLKSFGWKNRTPLDKSLKQTHQWFVSECIEYLEF